MSELQASPITWVDVARVVAQQDKTSVPSVVLEVRVGWFGVTVAIKDGSERQAALAWLEGLFPGRLSGDPLNLVLEGPTDADSLPVEFEIVEGASPRSPTFGTVDGVIGFRSAPVVDVTRPTPVVAALSVKGGTGRTATATALALRWAKSAARPVLLVDADVEAPGISYLFREALGTPRVSLEDLIALAHADDTDGAQRTVDFIAGRLRDHHVDGNLIILPLRRDVDELASSSLRAEHLVTPDRPFALADLLSMVAHSLGCAGVVIDVRAGLMPLAVNLALDPNTSPIFVTTLSSQSILATSALISFISREIRRANSLPPAPLVVVNRVPRLILQEGLDDKILNPLLERLADTYSGTSVVAASDDLFSTEGVTTEQPTVIRVPEISDMQLSAGGWTSYVAQISSSGFDRELGSDLETWLRSELGTDVPSTPVINNIPQLTTEEARGKLASFANSLVAAENSPTISKPLVTKPLAALVGRFQSEVPIAVCEGSKGTGKTLAARYFMSLGSWGGIAESLLGSRTVVDATIIPVCASIQASSSLQSETDEARAKAASKLGLEAPQPVAETVSWIKAELLKDRDERWWTDAWLDLVAWSAGHRKGEVGAGGTFIELLRTKQTSAVGLIEGLEELYGSTRDTGVAALTRAALIGVPQRLRSEIRRPLGLIAFARRDTVEGAIRQNLDQFRREYSPFALTWTEDDVLELTAWLVTQAEALPGLWDSNFSDLPQAEKARRLEPLWGRKLGPDDKQERRTREAYTATWVVAVLSDLQGRLVPRDLIRLLENAAKAIAQKEESEMYRNRLLFPRALKSAVEPTSQSKARETEEEIPELRAIFAKFRKNAEQITAPLDEGAIQTLGLEPTELSALQNHGIVFGDIPPFEVPELFRRGLGLRHAGARRSVVNLYRKARRA